MVQPRQTHRPPLRAVLEAYANVTAATYTAKAGDRVIGVNRAGAVTITLPTAEVRKGRVYTVKDESGAAATNNITVATEGAETIDGSATDTITENYGSKIYYSDGSNWFTVPLLSVATHTLASHSAKAHSDLTGVGTDDHHAKAHQADHNSAGADALKLDDLAAPDDNTDLNFSITKHGLVPKGPNTGNFLKDDGSWATAAGAVTREGGNTTEATTTSTSEVDLLSATSMSIATTLPINYQFIFRKTSGAASSGFVGLKVNTTSIALANNFPIGKTSNTDQAESRHASGTLGPRIANYLRSGEFFRSGTTDGADSVGAGGMGSADMPTATITALIIRGIVYSASVTLGADELHVYSLAVS